MKLPFENIKRKVLIRREEPEQASVERSIKELLEYGIINVNKHSGPTSHQISDYVQRILKIKKAGHSGSLDPIVTGVLPVALDKATRIVQTLLKAGKEYIAVMHLHKEVPQSLIHKTKPIGKITQLPPVRSAVKREEREREVYYLEILEIKGQEVLFKIGCEAGTYIRKICHDWGLSLGTNAHMAQLVRTKAGPFNLEESFSLYDLKDAYEYYRKGDESKLREIILPIESAVEHLAKIYVVDQAIKALVHGTDLYVPGVVKLDSNIKKGDVVCVFSLDNRLIALGEAELSSEEIMKLEKGTAVRTRKVFRPL